MLGSLCGTPDPASGPRVLGSPTDQIYQLYDDYFDDVAANPDWRVRKAQPAPQPIDWPEPVVLPREALRVMDHTYVPIMQKLPQLAGLTRPPPRLRDSFTQLLQDLRGQWEASLPEGLRNPPVPPARTSSLPKTPPRVLPAPGEPMPPPRAPNPKRPLPKPPPRALPQPPQPAVLRPPLPPPPGPPPTIPLPDPPKGVLPAQDRTRLSPNDVRGFVQATSGLRPLRLPQLVAERQQGLRPLILPERARLLRVPSTRVVPESWAWRGASTEALVEETELAYLRPQADASGAAGPHAAPEGPQQRPATAEAPAVGVAQ